MDLNASVSLVGRMFAQAQVLGDRAVQRVQKAVEPVTTDMLRAFEYERVNYCRVS